MVTVHPGAGFPRSRWKLVVALLVGVLSGGCGEQGVLVPDTQEPFFYLVLNQRSASTYQGIHWTGQQALLTTTGSPVEPPRYRTAREFTMWRASDGARFGWRRYPQLVSEPGTSSQLTLLYANYFLPDSAGPEGLLGARDLRPGQTYEIVVTLENEVIRGRTTIPAEFTASLRESGDHRSVVWPRVQGAGGYQISLSSGATLLQTDTTLAVPRDIAGGGSVLIQALDPNLYRYVSEKNTARSGIDAGFGVFGAVTFARVVL